ncbi:MAG: hypothetical protein WBO55_07975 [Rhizobiaceae bacterium]
MANDVSEILVPAGKRIFCTSTKNSPYRTHYTFRWPEVQFIAGKSLTHSSDGGTSLQIPAYAEAKIWKVYGTFRPGVSFKPMIISATPTPDGLIWLIEFWTNSVSGDPNTSVSVSIID